MPKKVYECRGVTLEIATDTTRVEFSLQQGGKWIVARIEDEQLLKICRQLEKAVYERNIE